MTAPAARTAEDQRLINFANVGKCRMTAQSFVCDQLVSTAESHLAENLQDTRRMITVDLKTVRALKAEIPEQIIRPPVTEIRTEHRIIRSTATWRLTGVEGWIALGAAATVLCFPLLAMSSPASAQTRADGAQLVYATSGTISAQNPAFSPDGTTLIFTLYLKGYDGGKNQPECSIQKKPVMSAVFGKCPLPTPAAPHQR